MSGERCGSATQFYVQGLCYWTSIGKSAGQRSKLLGTVKHSYKSYKFSTTKNRKKKNDFHYRLRNPVLQAKKSVVFIVTKSYMIEKPTA